MTEESLGTCWCGAKLNGDSFADIDTPCGGSGVLICFCGGDCFLFGGDQ